MKKVIHYKCGSYLPITEAWIYEQITNLLSYLPIVYCFSVSNLNIYPIKFIRALAKSQNRITLEGCLSKICSKIFNFIPFFFLALLKDKPQLVHAHFGPSGYNFLALKKIYKVPLVTAFYGYDLSVLIKNSRVWIKRYKKLFQEGELFLVEGTQMKNRLLELGCPERKIIIQHHGVNLAKIKFKARTLLGSEEIKIIVFGRFVEKKGIPYAIEAFGLVKQLHPELKLRLTIIGESNGQAQEEEEKRKILALIKKFRIEDDTHLAGYQPHSEFLDQLLEQHIFMHPSIHAANGDNEGGAPVALIEASASGMPVLSTKHCDIPEVIIDGVSGYLVTEKDVAALSEKLEFLVLNPQIWEKLGLAGRRHLEQNYDSQKQIQHLESIYDALISGSLANTNLL